MSDWLIMPMLGAPTMSMVWMRMPDQTWGGAAASFVGMWVLMMVPMMLPTVAPALWRHHAAAKLSGTRRPAALTAIAGAGYFFVWAVVGSAAFPVGAVVASLGAQNSALARAMPIAIGLTVTIAGAVQLTSWKAHRLAACCWRSWSGAPPRMDGLDVAWRRGIQFGLRCAASCANLMVIPLVVGVMDMRAMAAVAAAITVERLAPHGERVARVTGVMLFAVGGILTVRVVGP